MLGVYKFGGVEGEEMKITDKMRISWLSNQDFDSGRGILWFNFASLTYSAYDGEFCKKGKTVRSAIDKAILAGKK